MPVPESLAVLSAWLGWSIAALALSTALATYLIRTLRDPARRRALAVRRISPEYIEHALFPDGLGGEIQIDYLLRLPDRILVVDMCEHRGLILGGEALTEWTCVSDRKHRRFPNPLHDHRMRVRCVSELIPGIPVAGRIVFDDSVGFSAVTPPSTCRWNDLLADVGTREAAPALVPGLEAAWARLKELARPADPLKPLAMH